MRLTNRYMLTLLLTSVFALGGCEQEGPAEEAGENIDEGMESMQEQAEDTGEAMEDQAEEMEEGMEQN